MNETRCINRVLDPLEKKILTIRRTNPTAMLKAVYLRHGKEMPRYELGDGVYWRIANVGMSGYYATSDGAWDVAWQICNAKGKATA